MRQMSDLGRRGRVGLTFLESSSISTSPTTFFDTNNLNEAVRQSAQDRTDCQSLLLTTRRGLRDP